MSGRWKTHMRFNVFESLYEFSIEDIVLCYFYFFNNLIKLNKVDVKFCKRQNILFEWVILLFIIILSIEVFVNIN